MHVTWLDLLKIQRDLYRLPRNYDRFREYLQTMIKPEGTGLELPLVAMNPMAHDHVPALLDHYLALDADRCRQVWARSGRGAGARIGGNRSRNRGGPGHGGRLARGLDQSVFDRTAGPSRGRPGPV